MSYVFCPRPPVLVNQCLCHYVCQKGCLSPPSRVGSLEHQRLLSFLHHRGVCAKLSHLLSVAFSPCPSVCFGVGGKPQALSAAKVSLSGPRPPEGASARVSPNPNTACGSQATRAWLSCSQTRRIMGLPPQVFLHNVLLEHTPVCVLSLSCNGCLCL